MRHRRQLIAYWYMYSPHLEDHRSSLIPIHAYVVDGVSSLTIRYHGRVNRSVADLRCSPGAPGVQETDMAKKRTPITHVTQFFTCLMLAVMCLLCRLVVLFLTRFLTSRHFGALHHLRTLLLSPAPPRHRLCPRDQSAWNIGHGHAGLFSLRGHGRHSARLWLCYRQWCCYSHTKVEGGGNSWFRFDAF
ncbi:hypothetical protein BJY52DRAFT_453913 [Lactarius psammicola]|nr:hypothetical protein BJY52DRAFT_453913 [Lactarius psammicola]